MITRYLNIVNLVFWHDDLCFHAADLASDDDVPVILSPFFISTSWGNYNLSFTDLFWHLLDLQHTGEDDGSSDEEGMLCEFHIRFFSLKLLYPIGFWIDMSCFHIIHTNKHTWYCSVLLKVSSFANQHHLKMQRVVFCCKKNLPFFIYDFLCESLNLFSFVTNVFLEHKLCY